MKIGILTFHRSYNYGAFMQCFSLVKKLQKDFPEQIIEVIDFSSRKAMDGYTRDIERIQDENLRKRIKARNVAFTKVQGDLPLSTWNKISDEYIDTIEFMNREYDAVIVGSDAVWNWTVRGIPNIYFLDAYKGCKFSYAASAHGLNYQNMTEEQRAYVKNAFLDFKYIGVRDITTENMVKYADDTLRVYHNCDPTAFLNLEDVPCDIDKLKEKMQKAGVDFSKPLIGVMASNAIGRSIKKYWAGKAQIIALYEPNKYADVFLNDLTPYEWAKVFSLFKVTVTHFFHGTMLSLVNGTPVIPIEFTNAFSAVNKTKIHDVMDRLELSDWRFTANYRNMSKVIRVFKKLGLWQDHQLWNAVNKLIADCMHNDYSDMIRQKLELEVQNYMSLQQAIDQMIKENNNG